MLEVLGHKKELHLCGGKNGDITRNLLTNQDLASFNSAMPSLRSRLVTTVNVLSMDCAFFPYQYLILWSQEVSQLSKQCCLCYSVGSFNLPYI